MREVQGLDTNLNPMLNELRRLSAAASREDGPFSSSNITTFASTFETALENVNRVQRESGELKRAFELGEQISLVEVMIAQQKARLHFQTALQVRNRLISAYQDLMNMPL